MRHDLGIVFAARALWRFGTYRYRGDSNNVAVAWQITFQEPMPAKPAAVVEFDGKIFELFADLDSSTVRDALLSARMLVRVPGGSVELRALDSDSFRRTLAILGEELADEAMRQLGVWDLVSERKRAADAAAERPDYRAG